MLQNTSKNQNIPFLFIGAVCFLLFGLNVKTFVPLFIIFIAIICSQIDFSKLFVKKPTDEIEKTE